MAMFGKNDKAASKGKTIDSEGADLLDDVEFTANDDGSADEAEADQGPAHFSEKDLHGVPHYNSADEETRAKMDSYLENLDVYDMRSIMAMGHEEMQRLASVAEEVEQKYGISDNPILSSLSDAEESLGALDFGNIAGKVGDYGKKGVKWAMQNPGTALASIGGSMVLGPLALLGLPGKAAYDVIQHKRKGPDFAEELRQKVQQTTETIIQIEKALDDIPEAVQDLDALGRSRMTSYREVSIIIGAGMEAMRRIDQDEVPALEKQIAADPHDFELAEQLEKLHMGRDWLARHVTNMMSSRAVSQASAVSLMHLRRVFGDVAGKLGAHLHQSVPQWQAQRAEAGVALFADKLVKTSDEADKHGNDMLKLSHKLNQNTAALMQKSLTKGSYDPQAVIKILEAQTSNLKKDFALLGSNRKDMETAMLQLSDASRKHSTNISNLQQKANGRVLLPNMNATEDAAIAITDQSEPTTATRAKKAGPQPK